MLVKLQNIYLLVEQQCLLSYLLESREKSFFKPIFGMMIIFGTKIYKNDDVCELVNMIHRIVTITNELKQLVVNKQCLQRADHKSQVLTGNNKIIFVCPCLVAMNMSSPGLVLVIATHLSPTLVTRLKVVHGDLSSLKQENF